MIQISRLVLLFGVLFSLIGCGGGDGKVPPAAPAIPEREASAPPTRQKQKSRTTKGRPSNPTGDNDPNLLEWNQRLTALRKIRSGMTIEQVEGIIGLADEADERDLGELNPAKSGQTLSTLTWRGDDDGDFIMIGFVNERLKDLSQIKVGAAKK